MNYGPFWYLCNLLQTKVSLLKEIKKAKIVFKSNSFQDSQLWKLDDESKLQNKEGRWKSDDNWNFKTKDELIYIEDISNKKFLQSSNDGNVFWMDFEENKPQQLWKQGKPDAEGYFTLESVNPFFFALTAVSTNRFQIAGNITLRWIGN